METAEANNGKLLAVRNLRTCFYTKKSVIKVANGLTYHVDKCECVGLLGESTCGKSVSTMAILRLISYTLGVIEGGTPGKCQIGS